LLYDLFTAYYDARRNKRNTKSALQFEKNYESNLFELYEEIINRQYQIKPSVCFINYGPVQREIFAADFRDRIVHHLVFNYISPIFERVFINDCYSCRKGKGTSYGINRVDGFIRSCSDNYKNNCYILKLDIQGYFMAINKDLLFAKTKAILEKFRYRVLKEKEPVSEKWVDIINFELVYYLLEKIIYNNPVVNFVRKGSSNDWQGLPPSKSLFYSGDGCGLPIGNLTSQLFSNIYLNDFDHWIKHNLQCKYYGRYVDDFIIIHQDRAFLKGLIPKIKKYLKEGIMLDLHPKKVYLQHHSKGVQFLGSFIKPYRIYIINRTKGKFYSSLNKWNFYIEQAENKQLNKQNLQLLLSSVNSYLGLLSQYQSYKLRKKMILGKMSKEFWEYVYLLDARKLVAKKLQR
jgi:hypothetical protein